MTQPNILFLFSDQHNPRVAGYEGDPCARTPNLDRLAEGGTRLSNCYCASPLCVPSRMAFLSGRHPDATGVFSNSQSLHSDVPTVAHALAIAGYETVLCGRMHFVGPDQRHGYTHRLVGDFTALRLGAMNANCGHTWAGTTGQHRQVIEKSGAGNSGVLEYDRDVSEAAISYLHNAPEKPWFLTVGWYGPHCTYCCPKELFDRYMDTIPPPDCPEDFRTTCHPAVRRWMERREVIEVSPEAVRRARAAYYGMVELTDQHVGAVLNALHEEGLAHNTLVVYASDHGDCLGHNGMWWKSNFYEGSVRVPCLFSQPEGVRTGSAVASPTSLLDLAPTFIEFAGAPVLPRPDGMSLAGILGGAPEMNDRAVLSMLGDGRGHGPAAMIRQGPWKLIDYSGFDNPQLFNLADDPDEQRDLGEDPCHAEIRDSLLRILRARWDAAAAQHVLDRAAEDLALIRQWNEATPPPPDEEFWQCAEGRNIRE